MSRGLGGGGLGEDTCLSGVWRHVPGGPNREYGKSQMAKIGTLTCSFLVAPHSKTDQRHLRRSRGSEPRPRHNSRRRAQKDDSEEPNKRANGVRLQATPADGLRQSPQVNGSSGPVLEREALRGGSQARRCGALGPQDRRRSGRGDITAGGLVGAGARPGVQHGPRIAECGPACPAIRGSVRRVTVQAAPMASTNGAPGIGLPPSLAASHEAICPPIYIESIHTV